MKGISKIVLQKENKFVTPAADIEFPLFNIFHFHNM